MMIALLVGFPLFGFLVNGVLHLKYSGSPKRAAIEGLSGWIATGVMTASFLLTLISWLSLRGIGAEHSITVNLFQWMKLGALSVDFLLRFDSLSSIFCLVITGVGTLIHLYSISYMSHDENRARYFAYLNLFCFMMLNLVLGGTLPHIFLGWEGVGLASYLLIGFWHQDEKKVLAGQKAFVMNRVGDLGFLLAMFIAFKFAGTLDVVALHQGIFSPHVAMVFGLLVFFACTGKSAQFPLFTWLPDAMAGPTPVSALIHAATMVTSGIYLLARLHGVISDSEIVLHTIAIVGGLTALGAAVNACVQSDIKKILAYSTISQLGFMFVACGVGAFDIGVFHVMTHAFFKALMFLGAGSVIHALHDEQDIFKYGGLKKAMPYTFATFVAGWAAIIGLPPFSGFFSKDAIIFEAYHSPHSNKIVFALVILSAALTSFYMTRLLILTFFGKSRVAKDKASHLHESPWIMVGPLMVLAVASLVGGWFGSPIHFEASVEADSNLEHLMMGFSVVIALGGAAFAYFKYKEAPQSESTRDLLGVDTAYGLIFGRGFTKLAEATARWAEEFLVQGVTTMTTAIIGLSGNMIKVVQGGSAQAYLLMMLMGGLIISFWVITRMGFNG